MDLYTLICQSLDNALDNGYNFLTMEPLHIATNLSTFDSQFEDSKIEDFIPHIITWQRRQQKITVILMKNTVKMSKPKLVTIKEFTKLVEETIDEDLQWLPYRDRLGQSRQQLDK